MKTSHLTDLNAGYQTPETHPVVKSLNVIRASRCVCVFFSSISWRLRCWKPNRCSSSGTYPGDINMVKAPGNTTLCNLLGWWVRAGKHTNIAQTATTRLGKNYYDDSPKRSWPAVRSPPLHFSIIRQCFSAPPRPDPSHSPYNNYAWSDRLFFFIVSQPKTV